MFATLHHRAPHLARSLIHTERKDRGTVQTNDEVAALLTEYADLTSITGGDRFRIRTYERAARSVAGYPEDVADLDSKGLQQIPNVGASVAAKIEEYLRTGAIGQLEELRAKVPAGVRRLTEIPGLGPKRAMALYTDLGIDSVDGLAAAIRDGKLADLPGFGAKSEENLLRGIELLEKAQGRVTLDVATDLAEDLIRRLSVVTGCERCTYAGSLRRMKDTIGDIDILAISVHPSALMDALKGFPHVTRVVASGPSKTTIATTTGLQVDLRVVPPDSGEIEAARRGELPDLVTVDDLRGDLHTHTDLTDGTASLEAMVSAAAARGYSYYAVTDHAPNLFMQRMTIEKMLAQREQVRSMDGKHAGMTLLHGTELNIDPDGKVDWPAGILREFDLTVASVHSHFTQSRAEMTRRLIRAVENPWVSILGHPSGRKIGKRPPVDADWDAVYAACARTGTAVEIDAFPDRLDASDEHIKIAHRHGAVFSIDSDAHAIGHLAHMRYGAGTAQRGWLTPADVINTWPLPRLRAFLHPT